MISQSAAAQLPLLGADAPAVRVCLPTSTLVNICCRPKTMTADEATEPFRVCSVDACQQLVWVRLSETTANDHSWTTGQIVTRSSKSRGPRGGCVGSL